MTVDVLTVEQLAGLLQCSDKTVRERAEQLGGLKFGRDYVFPASAVNRRLEALALDAAAKAEATPRPAPAGVLHAVPSTPKQRRKLPVLPALVRAT